MSKKKRHLIIKNFILIFAVLVSVLAVFLVDTNVAFADYAADSADVGYTPEDTDWDVDNVNDALDGLHFELIKQGCLANLTSNVGTFDKTFDPVVWEYNLSLGMYENNFTLSGIPIDGNAVVTGLGDYKMKTDFTKEIQVSVTDIDGVVRIYYVHVTQQGLAEGEHSSKLKWLEPTDLSYETDFVPDFYPLTTEYDIDIYLEEVYMSFIHGTYDPEAEVTFEGNRYLEEDEDVITVTVHAPSVEDTVYQITYHKVDMDLPDFKSRDNFLAALLVDHGTLNPNFDMLTENYTLPLLVDETRLKVNARPKSDLATIQGNGEYMIPAGTYEIPITVTSESEEDRVYKITTSRPASPEDKAKDIIITGLVQDVCVDYPGYCELDNEFDSQRYEYYMTVPSGIRELEFTVDKMHDYQTIIGDGVSKLKNEENTVTIEITSEDGEHQKVYTYHITRDLTDDNYLDSLVAKPVDDQDNVGNEIDLGFHHLIEEYSFKVDNEITHLDLTVTPDDSRATYEIIGNENFAVGNNVVDIEVKAVNNEIRTYRLNVYRVSDNNPLLENIEVTNGADTYTLSPAFNDVTRKYTVTVENEVSSVNIAATPQKNTTTVTGDGLKTLNVGRNPYTISTLAEGGMTFTYEVVVIRLKNSNNFLSTLSVAEGNIDPTFDKDENNYSLTVEPHIKSLTITATPEVETSNVSIIGNSNFRIGENEVIVRVTAEDNSTNDYVITVTKEGSDNNFLSSLSVKNGETELLGSFDKNTPTYEIQVGNEVTSVSVTGELEDSLSTVTGLRDYNLSTGNNSITITVTSETGIDNTYTVNIIRDKNSDASLNAINVSSGSVGLLEGVYEYTLEVENNVSSITVTGIPSVSTTTVTGNGTFELTSGVERTIELVTLAEDQVNTLTYTLKVTRKKNANAYLSTLSISEGNIKDAFVKTTNNYTLKVRNNITSVTVNATAEVETSSLVIDNPETLTEGDNEVKVTVTAENGDINIYKVTVTRLSEEASKLNLATLDVRGCTLDPVFDPDTSSYSCTVGYDLSDTDVTATAIQEEYHVSGTGAKTLEVGENVLTVTVEDEKKTESNEYTIRVTRLESAETRLRNITITGNTLNEVFSSDSPNYTLNTTDNNLTINCEKMHNGQEITITGNNGLTVGSNLVQIHVVAANGVDSGDYYITVTKDRNTNNYLQALGVEGYNITPSFTKGRSNYTLEVENEVESVVVTATAEEATSSVSGTGMYTLTKGKNTVTVTVTAENEVAREYTIEITRLGSKNAYLSSLSVTGYNITPAFDKEETSYTLAVPYEVSTVDINAVSEDSRAFIAGDGTVSLNQGLNNKTIIVTSEHGNTKVYTIAITRNNPVTSKLKNITVQNYSLSPVFESNTTEYTVVIDNEVEHLNMTIEKLDPNSTYEIIGNQGLQVGENEVKVVCTSSGDPSDKTTYTLTVVRQEFSNTYLSNLTVSEGELDPSFDRTVLSYEVEVPYSVSTIDIEGTAENSGATVTGNGVKNLSVGDNNYEIKVSLNGITRTYKVKVTRKGSNNANILSITSNLGTVTKVEDTIYSLTVPYTTTEVLSNNFTVTAEDPNAVVSKQGRLDLGVSQTYNIRVTSEDGETIKDYVVNIILDKSTNNYLSTLVPSVGTLNPDFIKTKESYNIGVLDTVSEIEFTATLEDDRAEILNNTLVFDLPEYSNTIEIQVKSEKGGIRTYTIVVTKSATRERTLSNVELTGLGEFEVDYEFYETTYDYSLTVPYDISEVGFNITKKHPNQIVMIYENEANVNKCSLAVGENVCEIRVTNSFNETLTYTYTIERLKNTNNYLSSLRLTSPSYEFEDFDRDKLEYSVTVPQNYENIEVEAIAEDTENARVRITGTTYLVEGMDNDVRVRVTAQNGSVRDYVIHVLRLPSSNNLLKTLTVSSGEIYILSPKFTPGNTEYTLEVPSPIDLVSVEGLALDENSTVQGNGDYNLRIGLNKIEIKVISSDLQERVYKINITRLAEKNVYLSKLEVLNGTMSPDFDKTKGYYSVNLPYTESALGLDIATEDPNATYEILGNSNLKYGANEVRIKVTSSDGSASKTYVLNVNKQGNINNNLESLTIDGELIDGFDPNIINYTYVVEYATDKVLVGATPEYNTSTVVGTGYKSLVEGSNTITVDVVSQSGNRKTYTVTVTRKLNTNLMAIVTDRGEVTPEFDKETNQYTLEVENNIKDITVIGVRESSNATVTGNGKYDLIVGNNEINLVVTNGVYSNTYTLTVTRKGSTNTNLKYLTVAESILDKDFSNSENDYTLYIQDDITSLSLSYEPEDETSVVEVIGNENFDEANETVTIKVTSTGGQVREIKLHVIREPESTFSNKLLDLSVNRGTMSPRFTEDVQEYTVTVSRNTTDITISATRRGNQEIEGVGTKLITKEREEFKVTVTSKDGKSRTYTLIVYKEAGTDARLNKLEFNEGYLTPSFNKNVYNYVLTTSSDTMLVTTKEIETVDEGATYEIFGTLLSGANDQITIQVTAADGVTKKNYVISVLLEKSNNAYLSNISSNIGSLTPTFDKEIQSYEINVENEVSDIIIDAVPENSKATILGDGMHSLRTGPNAINILVTAEAGNVRNYTVIVNRALSSNVDLKDLYVRGYTITPGFDKDQLDYTLEVENDVTYVDIDGELADRLSSVVGLGRVDLNVGENVCDIIVTAEAGNFKTYTITITRKDKLSSKIENLLVKEGTLSPTFGKEQLEYTISIPNEYRKITPIITLEDPNATYNIVGNSNLNVGNNEVSIVVTSSDGQDTTTYKLNVIRNISSNNYLSTLAVDNGTLSPAFDKTVGYYEVSVDNDIDEITVTGTPEATTTFIAGLGTYDLDVGVNMILIRTMSESGIPRSYQIKVIRASNDSNYLTALSVDEGSLNPVFDKDHTSYAVAVPVGTREVTVVGTLESETASVTGLGTHTIKVGSNTIDVTVTSEGGDVRTYQLTITRPSSSNTNITTFTPDSGTLSPGFTNDNDNYTLSIGKNTNVVNIEVVPESADAKVGGNKNISISGNSKVATISVLAEDNTLREITVTINKAIELEDITINNKDILIVKGEEVELDITTTPAGENPTYTYDIENNIISISGKTITGLIEGTTKVTVKTSENELIEKDIQVKVVSNVITSSTYEIVDKTDRIIVGAEEGTTVREFKDNLLNDIKTINIYDSEGNLLSDSDIVSTGLIVKLENNNVVYDSAILIVKGDVDGDGIVDVTDESMVLEDILGLAPIEGVGRYAADVLEDELLDVSDDSNILDYILKLLNSLN